MVYRPWPEKVIADAIREFNDQMHDGAGIPEIQAGLHGLDFLTRRSNVDDNLQARLDGAITEARMRIELLAAKEAEDRTAEEQRAMALKSVENLCLGLESIRRRFLDTDRFDAQEVREMVRLRLRRAL
jgi:hypothetical protein